MTDTKQNISEAFGADTQRLKTWEDAIKHAISQDGNTMSDPSQITVKLDKWEKDVAKQRLDNEL